jgi:hypothetical protein
MIRMPERIGSRQQTPDADTPPAPSDAAPADRMTEADYEAVARACEIFGCGLAGLQ